MKKYILNIIAIITLLIAFSGSVLSQSIRGTVKSGSDGTSIPNVPITIGGDLVGMSDLNGNFVISVTAGTNIIGATYNGIKIEKEITFVAGDNWMNFWFDPPSLPSDYDGNYYHTVNIGTQTWMVENLKVTHFRQGTNISNVTDNSLWGSLLSPGYCWYNNDFSSYKETYGALYNWFAVNTRNLCPTGWHVPSDIEYIELTEYLGGADVAGVKLKEAGTVHWYEYMQSTAGTNESGFTALPGGFRYEGNGSFNDLTFIGYYWTSKSNALGSAEYRYMANSGTGIYTSNTTQKPGFSVRCIQSSQPLATTNSITSLTTSSVECEGNVTSDGGEPITERGVCWNNTGNPTISDNVIHQGAEVGIFNCLITDLEPNSTYYVKAYATNAIGTGYGNEIEFTTLNLPNIVTNTYDFNPSSGDQPIYGSLRAAIEYANSNPETDRIEFNIPGEGIHTIQPLTQLPDITESATIDGFSQPGASSENQILLIEINGTNAGEKSNGFVIKADNCLIKGLVINGFSGSGIYLDHASSNIIESNFIGTDNTGITKIGNGTYNSLTNNGEGAGISIYISDNNIIGGSTPSAGNIISGNPYIGILIRGDVIENTVYTSSGNKIKGNLIGTDISGANSLANRYGIKIDKSVSTDIGGLLSEERNIISGNNFGIYITGSDTSKGNIIRGNYVGTDITGTKPVQIGSNENGQPIYQGGGVLIYASETIIGGSLPEARNIISGNASQGLAISGSLNHLGPASGNIIRGNYIGTDVSGTLAVPNGFGIMIMNSGNNQIGGDIKTDGNLLSGNREVGIYAGYEDATGNKIEGNLIGTTADGTQALGNGLGMEDLYGYGGVNINGPGNSVGGTDPLKRNIISGNLTGITLRDTADNCIISGNYIGVDINGTKAIPNINNGISIKGGKNNLIGGSENSIRNIISGNLKSGIFITFSDVFPTLGNNPEYSTNNIIQDNYIGTDVTGAEAIGNSLAGISLVTGANNNQITQNTIADNGGSGVSCSGPDDPPSGNSISSNSIYSNGLLGIELAGGTEDSYGVTENDEESLTGPNNLQNYPMIGSVSFSPGLVNIMGTFTSKPSFQYSLQFFANLITDNSGHGEGQTYLGSQTITTDASGNASFTLSLPIFGRDGQVITATATDPLGNTSEFSNAVGGMADQTAGMGWPIHYRYNETGASRITDNTDITAITNSFQTWAEISTAAISFTNDGPTTAAYANANDGVNLVSFVDDQYGWTPGVLAYAAKTVKMDASGTETGLIIDADIIVNPEFAGALKGTSSPDESGTSGYYDIQSIITHEIGHILGLYHSGVLDATMFFWLQDGKTHERSLTEDDMAWASYKYQGDDYVTTYGTLTGNIQYGYSPGTNVAGSLILAGKAPDKPEFHSYSDADGNFTVPVLRGIGDPYYIHIEPLDNDVYGFPMTPGNISSYIFSNTVYTDYPGEYYNQGDSGGDLGTDGKPSDDETKSDPVAFSDCPVYIITNKDVTPPVVNSISPAMDESNLPVLDVLPNIIITFSEPVDITSFSDASCYLEAGTEKYFGYFTKMGGYSDVIIFTPVKPLPYSKTFELRLLGTTKQETSGITDLRGNRLDVEGLMPYSISTIDSDNIPPVVINTYPVNGASEVFITEKISIFFSEPMNKKSVQDFFSLSESGNSITGTFSWNNNLTTVIFTPDRPLLENKTYNILLPVTVTDLHGIGLTANVNVLFSTVTTSRPVITYRGPTDKKTDVTVSTPVVVDFSEPVNTSTVTTESFSLLLNGSQVQGTFEFLNEDSRVVFRPSASLEFGTVYTVILSESIMDASVVPQNLNLNGIYSTTFTTETKPSSPVIYYIDPPSGARGDKVTISGEGFDPVPANNQVSFAGVPAVITDATLNSIAVKVPYTALSGMVNVTVKGTSANPGFFFYVIPEKLDLTENWTTANTSTGSNSRGVTLTTDGATAFVTNPGSGTVSRIDLASMDETHTYLVGTMPLKIDLDPSNKKAYVTNYGSNTVSVIDLLNNDADIKEINVGLNPYGIAVTPNGDMVYVANYSSGDLSVIDINPASGGFDHVVANVNTGTNNRDLAVTGDAGLVLVAGDDGLKIVNINPKDANFNCVVATASSGTRTREVSPSGDATLAVVTTEEGTLLLIDIFPQSDYFGTAIASASSSSSIKSATLSGESLHIFASTEANDILIYEIIMGSTGTSQESSAGKIILDELDIKITGAGDEDLVFDTRNERLVSIYSGDNLPTGMITVTGFFIQSKPESGISEIIYIVQQMINTGSIKRANGNELISFLTSAISYLQAGKTKDAINRLGTFVVKVRDYVKSRQIDATIGLDLIVKANNIIIQLGGKPKSDENNVDLLNIDQLSDPLIIEKTGISSVYPNPSNGEITVSYTISSEELSAVNVSVKVYDLTGRVVGDLVDENLGTGIYSVTWNACNTEGNLIPYGIYFVKMTAGNKQEIRRILLVK